MPNFKNTLSSRIALRGGICLLAITLALLGLGWALNPLASTVAYVVCVAFVLLAAGLVMYLNQRQVANFSRELSTGLQKTLGLCGDLVAGKSVELAPVAPSDALGSFTESLHALLSAQQSKIGNLRITDHVFRTAGEGILVSDIEGKVLDINPQLLKITGYTRAQLLGKPAGMLYRQQVSSNTSLQIRDGLLEEGFWRGETTFVDREDRAIPVLLSVSKITDEQGERQGYVSIFSDIRHTKDVEAELRRLTTTDRLTGLPNYVTFSQKLEERLAQTQVREKRFIFLYVDIDRLRTINDRYGPKTGDKVIAQVAAYLELVLPSAGEVCRRSAGEFIVLVEVEKEQFLEQLKAALPHLLRRVPATSGAESFELTLSCGAALYPDQAQTLNELLQASDAALQSSKELGRAQLVWYTEALGEAISRRRAIEERLQLAITANLVRPFYQPEVDMRTGKIIGFEALARWEDEFYGVISPGEFIVIAEEGRLIQGLSESLLQQVLDDLPRILEAFPGTKVAYNASPLLFRDKHLVAMLSKDLSEHPEILTGLEIEVTESHAAESAAEIFGQLKSIRSLGVDIAIDDFGTGYSSFSRLAKMPINRLKIDSGFIAGLADATQKKIIVAIINLAKTLDLEVTAEGVETLAQSDALLAAGCHRAQGWLYARAMPCEAVLKLEAHL